MSSYTQIMQDFVAQAPSYTIDLPQNWLQGRTAFGGLTSALLYEAIDHHYDDLPPLRTMQVNFIGPATGILTVELKELRRGKNNVTIEAKLNSELGAGTYGYFTFGRTRELSQSLDYPTKRFDEAPEEGELMRHMDNVPSFLDNFERRQVSGPAIFSGSHNPEVYLWTRHVDVNARSGVSPLLVLGDGPPAALFALKKMQALSSMNWNVNILTDDLSTRDGWWLMRSATQFIKDGYSSQFIEMWNSDGVRVMDSIQHQAVFE